MTSLPALVRSERLRTIIVADCMAAVGLGSAWVFVQMRRVMDIGGSCASGGPYVIETPCPDGSGTFLMLGIGLWFAGVFAALILTSSLAPLFTGWIALFGSLGWNFLDYSFAGETIEGSWLVCGIVFELMALPAVYLLWRFAVRGRELWAVALWLGALAAGVWLGLLDRP